jgi:plastocyanin
MTTFSMTRRGRALLIAATLGAVSSLPARAADTEVKIDNFTFTPKELTVKAGTTVVFRNQDDIPHIVVGAKGEFHSKALDTGDGFTFTFAKAGSYGYFCGLHPKCKARSWSRRDAGNDQNRMRILIHFVERGLMPAGRSAP